jgi:hypothetical protein
MCRGLLNLFGIAMNPKKVVAKAVRMEFDELKDDVYIVFKITDEQFKQKIRANWLDDVELKLLGKDLYQD